MAVQVPSDGRYRLLVHVEGQTEETFVREVLDPHLRGFGYARIEARLLGNARMRDRRGGSRSWPAVRGEIVAHLKGDPYCLATTMVDYYGLPRSGSRSWPGRNEAAGLPHAQKPKAVEQAMLADICTKLGSRFDPRRFIPNVVMHEFEGLLFSDCIEFSRGIDRPDVAEQFQAVRDTFATPEEINDSPSTCPSRRVSSIVAGYNKPLHGALAAIEIGLAKIRSECPHFREWIERLERWPTG